MSTSADTHGGTCPECRVPVASPTARTCPAHGLYLLDEAALSKLDEAPLLGQILDGKYALIDLLGGGGYGSVYRGLQQPLGREVAVKVLHGLALNLKLGRDRFEREALALARLKSENTVRLIDFGVNREGPMGVRNLPYMVMEVIEGVDLERRVQQGALPPAEVVELLEGIADSLSEAHAAGIVHRDLKPSNVLMTRTHTGRVVPKVIDFGIARIEGTNKSQTGFVTGTPSYMAPEQARGESDLDPRADIYSLAAMTFELLSGRPPFVGNDALSVLTQHCTAPVPSLRMVSSDPLVWAFDRTIAAGMAKERADRPTSVMAFVAACREVLAGRADAPPLAPEPGNAAPFRTVAYNSPALEVASPNQTRTPAESATRVSEDAPTGLHVPTPMTISSLPAPAWAVTSPAAHRGRLGGVVVGVGIGLAAAGLTWVGLRSPWTTAPQAPVVEPVATAVPVRSAVVVTVPTTTEPARPMPASSTATAPATTVVSLPAPVDPASVAARLHQGTAQTAPPTRRPKQLTPPPSHATGDDAPQDVGPGEETRQKAIDADRALDECRCSAAARLVGQIAASPSGRDLAASRKTRLEACRPVDIDHRCVQGRLVGRARWGSSE